MPIKPECTSAYVCVCFCRYTLDNLKFGKMDITRYPDVAKKYVFSFFVSFHDVQFSLHAFLFLQIWSVLFCHLYCFDTLCCIIRYVSLMGDINLSKAWFLLYVCTFMTSMLWHCWLGGRKGIRSVKNWVVGYWCGYLSDMRCKWFAYGPADATATPSCLASLKSRMVHLLVPAYPGCAGKKPLNRYSSRLIYVW